MDIAASSNKTWNAVIDIFAANNIPIKTIDRASGFIATDPLNVPYALSEATDLANCGRAADGSRGVLESVVYNVLVRGDSAHSTVRVTAQWRGNVSGMFTNAHVDCSTTGKWESTLESQTRELAENRLGTAEPRAVTMESKCAQQDAAIVSRDRTDAEVYAPNAARSACAVARYCHYESSAVRFDKTVAIAQCRAEATKR